MTVRLSDQETKILWLYTRGHNSNTISHIVKASPHTVRTHLRNLRTKLGARTVTQAVWIARHELEAFGGGG